MPIDSIAIIPDGTRRWARRENLPLFNAYRHAFQNLLQQVDMLSKRGAKHIHLYLFSIYNLKRLPEEINSCLDAEAHFIEELIQSKYPIAVHGDIDAIRKAHKHIGETADRALSCTPSRDGTFLHLYIGYSFEHHIKSILQDTSSMEESLSALTRHSLDLVIRTGGAISLSDFLPIESRYSQIYFLPDLFNDISVTRLKELCDQFEATRSQLKYGE
ncbi:MAG TPA: undecaprenyl diphosphate synthase family protein [Paucimonas sp.]|nr:undecaprenyl diphosphate synthase family protein [Paucimonas sp.]